MAPSKKTSKSPVKSSERKKVVLAYSGGLDTSVAIRWLQEKYDVDVIAVGVDVGQPGQMDEAIERAYTIGAVKAYADGSLGSATAYFFEPLSDQPGNRGLLSDEMHPISLMRDRMMRADAAGLQLCTHAIGDAGISAILDIYGEIEKEHGSRDRRWRIEHLANPAFGNRSGRFV